MIEVHDLSKTYRVPLKAPGLWRSVRSLFLRQFEYVHAVRELSFSIPPGQRVGFLGPNGAGKTTTLKMLAGLLHPTSGDATVLGFVPRQRKRDFLFAVMNQLEPIVTWYDDEDDDFQVFTQRYWGTLEHEGKRNEHFHVQVRRGHTISL